MRSVALLLALCIAIAAVRADPTGFVGASGFSREICPGNNEYACSGVLSFDFGESSIERNLTLLSFIDAPTNTETSELQELGSKRVVYFPTRGTITHMYQEGRFQYGPDTSMVDSKPARWRKTKMWLDAETTNPVEATLNLPSYIRTAVKALVWDAVEDALLALVDGYPGVDHYYNYYGAGSSTQEFQHSIGYFREDDSGEWDWELIGSAVFNNVSEGSSNLGGVAAMAIDYDQDLLYLVGGYSHTHVSVRLRSDPLTVVRTHKMSVPMFSGAMVPFTDTAYQWQGLAFDFENDRLLASISTRSEPGASPFSSARLRRSHIGAVDLSAETVDYDFYLECNPGTCLRPGNSKRPLSEFTVWTGLALKSHPSTSVSVSAPESHEGSAFTATFEWDPIPPPDIRTTALATPVTGATVSNFQRQGLLRYTLDITPTGSADILISLPDSFAAPYPHAARSVTVQGFIPTPPPCMPTADNVLRCLSRQLKACPGA